MAARQGTGLGAILGHWDAANYAEIAQRGYHGKLWAFYPLYPLLLRVVGVTTGTLGDAPWVGAVLSAALMVGAVAAMRREAARVAPDAPGAAALVPLGPWSWFLLLASPASYVLHTAHTESLFLLLSFLALSAAAGGRVGRAALWTGLCVWTRNQGAFVAVGAACLAAETGPWRQRVGRFAVVAGAGAASFLAFLAFEAKVAGDPFRFLRAQQAWAHAGSVGSVLRTFWFGNAWQNDTPPTLFRHLFFFALAGTGLWLLRVRWPLGVYTLLSVAPLPLQGELINAFRFGLVLFPVPFLWGARMARLPAWSRWALASALLALNLSVARAYAVGRWGY